MKILKIGKSYFSSNNKYAIQKCGYGVGWDVYILKDHFKGYYHKTFKYLKDAKNYIMEK